MERKLFRKHQYIDFFLHKRVMAFFPLTDNSPAEPKIFGRRTWMKWDGRIELPISTSENLSPRKKDETDNAVIEINMETSMDEQTWKSEWESLVLSCIWQ